jgi:Thymidylate synthase
MSYPKDESQKNPLNCKQVWEEMNEMLANTKMIRNYARCIQLGPSGGKEEGTNNSYTIKSDLFPVEALKVYSAYNLGDVIEEEERRKYFSAHRGGSQGDYRNGMKNKIENVVDCLSKYPKSKRAVITIPNTSTPSHVSDDDAKCMREIHFYLDGNVLNATVFMRAQAAENFPKNIHFIGSLMERIAENLQGKSGIKVTIGELFYLATTLVSVRED